MGWGEPLKPRTKPEWVDGETVSFTWAIEAAVYDRMLTEQGMFVGHLSSVAKEQHGHQQWDRDLVITDIWRPTSNYGIKLVFVNAQFTKRTMRIPQ